MSTNQLTGRPREFAYARFRVTVTDGPDKGRSETSNDAEFGVGTAAGNRLVLTDPSVSRHHAVISATPRGFHLVDAGSTNGTFLAGYRVDSAWLASGALMRVGVSTLRFDSLADEVREPLSDDERFGHVLGRSLAMRRVFALLPRIAAADSTVLLEGETGTGKSLLASALHDASPRAKRPFVVLDCGAIPPTLIESELFGHERGAFTGAVAQRTGAFEAAQGGTVFLDEIGELSLEMQPKLLRALEDRTIKRVGNSLPIGLDVRVIAATNKDLRQAVNRGAFRADLYYRLNIVKLRVPALRERREDLPLLVGKFYEQFTGTPGAQPPPELVAELETHDWPGNVRELRSAIERAVLLGDPSLWRSLHEELDATSAPVSPDTFVDGLSFRAAKERAMASWERWWLTELVRRHDNNLSRAARAARMDRTHLRELLRRYRQDPGDDE